MASRRNSTEPAAALPESERKALSAGMAFALACAAALSAPTLYSLGRLIGYPPQLAWLLPAAFDGYAGTSIWVGRRIARTHPAAKAARRNARIALAMTVTCNGLYHLLALAGNAIPHGVHIGLLVVVSSLPPFIVDRLLHLNAIANGSAEAPTVQPTTVHRADRPTVHTKADRPPAVPSTAAAAVQPTERPSSTRTVQDAPRPSTIQAAVDGAPTVQPTRERWAEVGRPVYERLADELGKRPPEKPFRDALAAEAARLIRAGQLPESYDDPSLSTAKRARADIEAEPSDHAPLHPVPEREREAS